MNGGRSYPYLEQSYDDAMKKKYGYLFMDLSQECDDSLRFRNNIFPDEDCVVYKKK